MTQPPDLATTLHELLNPRVQIVQRDDQGAEQDHQQQLADLRARHAAHLRARHAAQAARVLARLMDTERRWAADADARTTARGELPSRLDQLAEAVHSSQGGGGAAAGPHRIPITLAAAELLTHIEDEVGHRGRPRTQLAAAVWAWARTAQPDTAAHLAADWLVEARAILEPERPIPIDGACPQCGVRTVHVDDSGEQVRRPALQVDRVSGEVTCIAARCGATWGPELHAHLGQVLEQQAAEQAHAVGGSAA